MHRMYKFQERLEKFMDYVISVVVRTPKSSYPFLRICKKTARNIKDEGYFI